MPALQELIGQYVLVAVGPVGEDPQPRVSFAGALRRGEDSPSMEVMKGLGRARPDDEGLLFHVGGSDAPAEKNFFMLTKGDFVDAQHDVSPFGDRFLYIECGGLLLTITTRDEAARALGRPPG